MEEREMWKGAEVGDQELIFRLIKLEVPMSYTSLLIATKGVKVLQCTEVTCGVMDA